MKWYEFIIILVFVSILSGIVGFSFKKCASPTVPSSGNHYKEKYDSLLKVEIINRFRIDSLENILAKKKPYIIIINNEKDTTDIDTTNIPVIFRKLANYLNK